VIAKRIRDGEMKEGKLLRGIAGFEFLGPSLGLRSRSFRLMMNVVAETPDEEALLVGAMIC
jgi:hypothetical protein